MINREVMTVLKLREKNKWYYAVWIPSVLLCVICLLSGSPAQVHGSTPEGNTGIAADYTNPDTGYRVIIEDNADLLSEDEEASLCSLMEPITEYGSAAFVTLDSNSYNSTEHYAEHFTDLRFSGSTGTVLVIDMDYRTLYLDTTGSMRTYLTSSYADSITDNIYSYASKGDYYTCAAKAFEQVETLLRGGRIAQPMKYICNLLLALVMALLINYLLVMHMSRKHKPTTAQLLSGIFHKFTIQNGAARLINQTRVYSPPSSNGGGHSGGGHSSGGHSGGGHSGGGHSGGGHRF